jgi:fumarylpyruvate hydrolase
METVIPAPQPIIAPMAGGGGFPVRRIYCVGQNYAAHAREMGSDPTRQKPFFFAKPADALATDGVFPYPPLSSEVHHEVELVVALGRGGRDIRVEEAEACIWGYAVGFDMTRRDLQAEAKKAGRPWDMAKGFDHSAPLGPITRASGPLGDAAIWMNVDGERRQSGRLSDLIWSVPEIIADLSRYVELKPGDLIFTGTPDGVGPVQRGQTLVGHVDGLEEVVVRVR